MVLIDKCPECGSENLIHDYDRAETICSDCGLVVRQQEMARGPEKRAYTLEEIESRTRTGLGTKQSIHDKGLSTSIIRISSDASGKRLPLATRLQMWRLRKWQISSRVHSAIERNRALAMSELNRLSDKIDIPGSVKEQTAVIYRKALEKRLVRGRSIAAMIAAALYVACRMTGTPRTLREISDVSLVPKKDVARCYRLLLRKLDIKMPLADPRKWISKIAQIIGISGETQGLAIKILLEAKRKRLTSGKDPKGLAAALLYIACLINNEKKTQNDIAEAAGVTEVTVRNRYRDLKQKLKLNLPTDQKRWSNP